MSTQITSKRRATQATDKPIKRTRVSRACDQCRTAREKCDGAQPTCSTCAVSKRTCTYTANVKKRGIQPGYIRALELALAYLFQHDPDNERMVNVKLAEGGSSSLLLSRESKESNRLHKRWRKAQFYTDVDRLLSGGETSRHDHSDSSPDSDDEHLDAKGPILAATENTFDQSSGLRNILGRTPDEYTPTLLRPSVTSDTTLTIPLDSWRLVEIYFTYTQSWFPISEKNTILKTLYSYPRDGLSLCSLLDSGDHAELWSILAVATASSASPQQSSSMAVEQLYETARSLVPSELVRFGLGHVKALLNLAIVDVGRQFFGAAWLLVGYASRILEVMDQTLLVLDLRHKHVFHGCFILDSMLALHLGRGPYFDADHITSYGRIDEDGLDEWQPWSDTSLGEQSRAPTLAFSSLNAMFHLLEILHNHAATTQDKLKKLETWKISLPPRLASICTTMSSDHRTPAAILLRSGFCCINLSLAWSEFWLLTFLDLLESAQDSLVWRRLPPVLHCLFEFAYQQSIQKSLGRSTRDHLLGLRATMNSAWPQLEREHSFAARAAQLAVDMHTPGLPSEEHRLYQSASADNALAAPSSFNSGPSSIVSIGTPSLVKSTGIITQRIPPDTMYPQIPNDLESFFDDLASLDTANDLDNQPQFMQNLGFSADANMADLFSEYPISTTFISQENDPLINLDHYGF